MLIIYWNILGYHLWQVSLFSGL